MSFKVKDHYYKRAKKENFAARSVYKLEEIDQKFKLFNKSDVVVDLGYHPGSWTQYVSQKVGQGKIVGIDIKPVSKQLQALKNVELFEMDVFDVTGPEDLNLEDKVDVLISDMAPNTTGIKSLDQDRSLNLIEKVFELAPKVLKNDGNLVVKVFDSHGAQMFLKEQKKSFQEWNFLKPKSTRSVSKEFFAIGQGYKSP